MARRKSNENGTTSDIVDRLRASDDFIKSGLTEKPKPKPKPAEPTEAAKISERIRG